MFFFLGFYISGVRQANAISCVFFAFTFIKDRKLVPYILLLAFAFLNHRSAIIALPVYWVFNFDKILGIKTQFLIIFSGFFIGQTIVFYLVDNYGDYLTLLGYDYLIDQIHDNEMKIEVESGLGIIFNYLVYSIIVIYSRKLYTYFQQDKNFYIYYNLFVFSVFCYGFTMHDQYLSRMTNFFRMSVPVILAYATFYAVCKRNFRIIWYPIIALYIILEIYKWSNSEWFFVF